MLELEQLKMSYTIVNLRGYTIGLSEGQQVVKVRRLQRHIFEGMLELERV